VAYCGGGESWVVELFSSQSPGRGFGDGQTYDPVDHARFNFNQDSHLAYARRYGWSVNSLAIAKELTVFSLPPELW
jgi:hypothetical protein